MMTIAKWRKYLCMKINCQFFSSINRSSDANLSKVDIVIYLVLVSTTFLAKCFFFTVNQGSVGTERGALAETDMKRHGDK